MRDFILKFTSIIYGSTLFEQNKVVWVSMQKLAFFVFAKQKCGFVFILKKIINTYDLKVHAQVTNSRLSYFNHIRKVKTCVISIVYNNMGKPLKCSLNIDSQALGILLLTLTTHSTLNFQHFFPMMFAIQNHSL